MKIREYGLENEYATNKDVDYSHILEQFLWNNYSRIMRISVKNLNPVNVCQNFKRAVRTHKYSMSVFKRKADIYIVKW